MDKKELLFNTKKIHIGHISLPQTDTQTHTTNINSNITNNYIVANYIQFNTEQIKAPTVCM